MAETWLPEEPPPLAPPPSKARRTVFTWLGLIAAFIILYAVMDKSPGAHRDRGTGVAGILVWGVPVALVVGLFAWMYGGSRRFNKLQAPGLAALEDGDYARAADQLGALARRYHARPGVGAVAAYNQGFALIRAGDAAAAVGVLLGVERRVNLRIDGLPRLVAIELTRAFAIGGDVDKATRWLEAARTRTPAQLGELPLVEGLVLCRAGRLDDALRHFEATWPRIEARTTVRNMREAWLLRAFAIASASTPRDSGAIEPWLRLLRSSPPGSLTWLTAHWPALATFAATHELA